MEYPQNVELKTLEGKNVRPFMLLEEQQNIVSKLLETEDYLDRQFILDCTLLSMVEGVEEGENYDLLKANGVFNELRNIFTDYIYDIECAVDFEESVEQSVKRFTQSLNDTAEQALKKLPSSKKLEQMFVMVSDKLTKQE